MARGVGVVLGAAAIVAVVLLAAPGPDRPVATIGHTGTIVTTTTTPAAPAPAPTTTTKPKPRAAATRSTTVIRTGAGGGLTVVNEGSATASSGNNTVVGPPSATVDEGPVTAVGNTAEVRIRP